MFKKLFIPLAIPLLMCSGCFEIIEEIDHNTDGSGNFSYLVNMSQSREKLSTLLSLDSVSGLRIPKKDDIEEQFEKGMQLVKSVKGISEVSITRDYENFIFNVSFHYDSLAALNNTAKLIHTNMSPFGKAFNTVFTIGSGGFTRVADAHSTAILQKLYTKNPSMLKEATYTTVYRFNQTVKSNDTDAKMSGNKKAIMYRYNTFNLAIKSEIIQQNVILK